ncbi:DNA primase [Elusimicrobium posterum]|uniref:DNA primase n=1 Tax=Elusimicrobium posterum TaxID=3116653 RepID=UPI003C78568E
MSEDIIEVIRDRVDIADLVREYVPSLKKAGKTYKGCCPFHQERTPSFTVNADRGLFYCFGCATGGDIFAFLMKIESLSFTEAAKKLAQRAGVEWKREESMSGEDMVKTRLRKTMDFAKTFFHKTLLSAQGTPARDYLKERGLTKETVEKFELGFTPAALDGLTKAAVAAGFKTEDLRSLGLTANSQYGSGRDYFRSRIMFPIINHRGECVGFGGRIFGEGEPKYLNSPETALFSKSRVLYGLNFAGPEIRKQDYSILLEGYMDVIGVMSAGVGNCVAPLGTSFNAEHAKLLKRYSDSAIILFDPDAAGIKASLRTALILIEQGMFVKVASLGEEGLDPDEYINKYGKEKFEEVLSSAEDILSFQADVLIKQQTHPLTAQAKSRVAAELMEIVSKQPDTIVKAEWLKTLSEKLDVDQSVLMSKFGAVKKQSTPARNYDKGRAAPSVNTQKRYPKEEEDLITWLLKHPTELKLAGGLDEGKLDGEGSWDIISAMLNFYNEHPHTQDVVPYLAQTLPQYESRIIKYAVEPLPKDFNPERDIKECIKR